MALTTPTTLPDPLPLFPLQTVLFPDGILALKVFEARYLDLVTQCLRTQSPFGVVGLRNGTEVQQPGMDVELETVGVVAALDDVDSETAGILRVRCKGTQRFRYERALRSDNGLWMAEQVQAIDGDEAVLPAPPLIGTVKALARALVAMQQDQPGAVTDERRFNEAGWVANRWCELLPIPTAARQKLMELPDPMARLEIVDRFLRDKGVVQD